jgi:cyclopropane-fatty-acyl-phospholipid synthase
MGFSGVAKAVEAVERGWLPDSLVRAGIRRLNRAGLRARRRLGIDGDHERFRNLLADMRAGPIALHTDEANAQHYEVPAGFFTQVLGRRRKYSGCYWPEGVETLDAAEEASLAETCAHADLADGQDVLELGCGWGSLTLWMAEHYPASRITAVSNSASQRAFIEAQARDRGFANITVVTADMNAFETTQQFDRVVSVEMFEHMRNHAALMERIAGWLRPDGKLFVHIFVHGLSTYLFEADGPANWMGRHFFTGGVMPADHLLLYHQRHLFIEDHWRQRGTHYAKTAEAWLANLDANRQAILPVLAKVYGADEKERWFQRWRVFFMACAELFGADAGNCWWVAHYRFAKR